MAKRSIQDLVKQLSKGLDTATSQRNMRLIGERCIDLILARTRRGFGVEKVDGPERPLKALSAAYIEYRQRYRRSLDGTTSPRLSNLTFSGQLLRSMTVKLSTNQKVVVGPNDRKRKGGLTNYELAQILERNGRSFNKLSKNEVKNIANFIENTLQLELIKI